jgi:peptide chain release factor 1
MNDYRQVQLDELNKKIEETRSLLSDPSMAELAQNELNQLEKQKNEIEESLRSQSSSQDSLDSHNIILEVKGATGGEEAKLWAEQLLQMYLKYAQKKGFRVEVLNETSLKIDGDGAFEEFKYEAGVHRVQKEAEFIHQPQPFPCFPSLRILTYILILRILNSRPTEPEEKADRTLIRSLQP